MISMLKRLTGWGASSVHQGDQIRRETSKRIVTALRTEQHRVNAEEVALRERSWFEGTLYPDTSKRNQHKEQTE